MLAVPTLLSGSLRLAPLRQWPLQWHHTLGKMKAKGLHDQKCTKHALTGEMLEAASTECESLAICKLSLGQFKSGRR